MSIGCNRVSPPTTADRGTAQRFWVGSGIAGEGNELAAVDVVLGDKFGAAGTAFASGLANQRQGHPAIIVSLQPNAAVKPSTLMATRTTLSSQNATVQFFDPVQQGVSRAIVDLVAEKVVPQDNVNDLVIIITVFIHKEAQDKAKLFRNNYEATKVAVRRAMVGEPSAEQLEKIRRSK
jgi:5,6,7,8-tetrahydromethanopterin hydro-lyase